MPRAPGPPVVGSPVATQRAWTVCGVGIGPVAAADVAPRLTGRLLLLVLP